MATLLSLGAHLGFLHSTMTCSALDGRGAGRKWEISLLEWAAAAGLVGAEAAGMSAALHSFQSRAAWLGNSSGIARERPSSAAGWSHWCVMGTGIVPAGSDLELSSLCC